MRKRPGAEGRETCRPPLSSFQEVWCPRCGRRIREVIVVSFGSAFGFVHLGMRPGRDSRPCGARLVIAPDPLSLRAQTILVSDSESIESALEREISGRAA